MNKISEQKKNFEESVFYRNNNFITTVKGKRNDFFLHEFVILETNYNSDEITLKIRDVYQDGMIEERLDEMIAKNRFNLFNRNKRIEVKITKISRRFIPLYEIVFEKCYLKEYFSETYSYDNSAIHCFVLKLKYKGRRYEMLTNDIMSEVEKDRCFKPTNSKKCNFNKTVLQYSNEMLEDCKRTVESKMKEGVVSGNYGKGSINLLDRAIEENNMKIKMTEK